MSRYAATFDALARREEGALGAFAMLGDPAAGSTAALLDDLVAAGADMVEVGIPFSDPVADGPVIQAAAQRALAAGVRVADCLELIAGFRSRHPHVPVGILTYTNLVMARGRRAFLTAAAEAGADSLLVADLPSMEAQSWVEEMLATGIEPVLIAAANTPSSTLARIAGLCSGYTYCVTRAGTTGTHAHAQFDASLVARLRDLGAPPAVFGFGISTPAQVRVAIQAGGAGVISGSAIVDTAARGGDVRSLVAALKAATRNDSAPS